MCSELIRFICYSEHLLATQCVLNHFSNFLGMSCDYDAITAAIWERNYPYNIVDMLEATEFPGAACAGKPKGS